MSKNYTQYFQEAFSKLRLLEQDFDISKEALDGIQKWKEDDNTDNLSSLEDVETVEIIDPEAWGVDDLQDDYVGKVILQCVSCQSTIVKDASEVYEDEETGNLCPDTECPVCHSQLGYTALGKVEHYDPAEEEGDEDEEKLDFPEEPDEDEVEVEEEDIVEESLHNKIRKRTFTEAKLNESNLPTRIEFPDYDELRKYGAIDPDVEDEDVNWDMGEIDTYLKNKYGVAPVDYEFDLAQKNPDPNYINIKWSTNESCKEELEEAKGDVCPDCGKNPCVCEGKDCADCDESCSKDEALNEGKTKITVYPVVCIDKMAPSGSGAEYVKYFKTMEAAKAWKEAHPDKAAFQYGIFPEEIIIEDGEDFDESCGKKLTEGISDEVLDAFYDEFDPSGDEYSGFVANDRYELNRMTSWLDEHDVEYSVNEADRDDDSYGAYAYINLKGLDESCSKDEGCGDKVEKGRSKDLKEGIENLSLDAGDTHMEMSSDESGRVSIVTEPLNAPMESPELDTVVPGEDSVVPLDNNDKENIEANISPDEQEDIIDNAEEPEEEAPVEEMPAEEEVPEEEMDFELEAESFNYLGNTFAKKLYENVASYEMTESKHNGNDFIVEGTIKFNFGNSKPTSFIFTEGYETKTGRLVLEGANKTFFPTKAFKLRGKIVEGKLVCESLRYNYSINKLNESTGKQEPVAVRGIVRGK